MKQLPLIILDRDGVINMESPDFIKSPEEWQAIPDSLAAIAQLNQHHFQVVIASNQSGVARRLFSLDTLNQIHAKMQAELALQQGKLDGIYFCPHHPDDGCNCRKPKTGLLEQIAADFNVNLKNTVVIGDSWRDIQAGLAVGAQCILVLTGNGKETLQKHQNELAHIIIKQNLAEAVDYIIHIYGNES